MFWQSYRVLFIDFLDKLSCMSAMNNSIVKGMFAEAL